MPTATRASKNKAPELHHSRIKENVVNVILSGYLIGLIEVVHRPAGSEYRPASYKCADGKWRQVGVVAAIGPKETPDEALADLLMLAETNTGKEIVPVENHFAQTWVTHR